MKEQFPQRPATGRAARVLRQRKKPAPPEQTHAENFYFVKQMQARTPVAVVLTDGETLRGTVEWYDRDCIKLTRYGSPNLLIYKHGIKYMYKDGEEAAKADRTAEWIERVIWSGGSDVTRRGCVSDTSRAFGESRVNYAACGSSGTRRRKSSALSHQPSL